MPKRASIFAPNATAADKKYVMDTLREFVRTSRSLTSKAA